MLQGALRDWALGSGENEKHGLHLDGRLEHLEEGTLCEAGRTLSFLAFSFTGEQAGGAWGHLGWRSAASGNSEGTVVFKAQGLGDTS